MDQVCQPSEKFKLRDRIILVILIAVVIFILTVFASNLTDPGLRDLRYSLGLAREWLAGNDLNLPYKLNIYLDVNFFLRLRL
jgi:hypothetical protein